MQTSVGQQLAEKELIESLERNLEAPRFADYVYELSVIERLVEQKLQELLSIPGP